MTIKIKNLAQTVTILESTSVIESGERMPRIVFDRKDWSFLTRPRWSQNKSVQREGNWRFYNGSDDKTGRVILYLTGATRYTNLETIQTLTDPIYFDADDINSNDSGDYILFVESVERNEAAKLIIVRLRLEAYNN